MNNYGHLSISKNTKKGWQPTHRKISVDMPWLLTICFLVGFATNTLPRFDEKKDVQSKPPEEITQLEINLNSKQSGAYMIFSDGKSISQGIFNSVKDLKSMIGNYHINRGYISTNNLDLSLRELEEFKQTLRLQNIKVYYVK